MFNFSQKHLRRTGTALAVVVSLWGAYSGSVHAQDKVYSFSIPAEDTAKALTDFSRQAGVQILFPYDLAAAHKTSAIAGQFTRQEILIRLLDGTGLEVAEQSATSITLRPKTQNLTKVSERQSSQATEVVVTGTHIRGGNPTSPARSISAREIENEGFAQVGDYIRTLPEASNSGRSRDIVSGTPSSSYGSGGSTLNLRGLGPDATLILIDGHRVAADEASPAPDVSSIPLAALQRVEIVTDGSSALYGSDAVAGVVNFILRKDFNGLDLGASVGGTTGGGGGEYDLNILGGKSSDTGYLLAGLERSNQAPIRASQRDFTAQMEPANMLQDGQGKTSGFMSGGFAVGQALNFSLDAFYTGRDSNLVVRTSPSTDSIHTKLNTTAFLLAPELTAKLPGKWLLTIETSLARDGDSEDSRYQTSNAHYLWNYRNDVDDGEVNANGPLVQLPAGPLRAAVGAGFRDETFRYWPLTGSGYNGSRTVHYAFAETLVPVVSPLQGVPGVRDLDLSAAVRTERYSDFGSTTNPKLGIYYSPIEDWGLRGTWGRSFKAPSFLQTAMPSEVYLFNSAIVGGSASTTSLLGLGGNPNLKPERSKSWSSTVEWSPTGTGFKMSVSYFNIDYTDRVDTPIAVLGQALTNPIYAQFVTKTPTPAQQQQIIAAVGLFANYTGGTYDPSNVAAFVDSRYTNVSAETAHGVDLSISKSLQIDGGALSVASNTSWLDLRQQILPGVSSQPLSGQFSYPARLRDRTVLNWSKDDYSLTFAANYVSGETDSNVTPAEKVAAWTTFDCSFNYAFSTAAAAKTELSLAIMNLFDRAPPYVHAANYQTTGLFYDSANASPIGRFVSVTLRQHF